MADLSLIRGMSVRMPDNQEGVVRIEHVQLDIMARRSEGKPGSSPNGLTVRPLVLQKTSAKSFSEDDQLVSENDAKPDGNCSSYESNLDGMGGGHHLPSCTAAGMSQAAKTAVVYGHGKRFLTLKNPAANVQNGPSSDGLATTKHWALGYQ